VRPRIHRVRSPKKTSGTFIELVGAEGEEIAIRHDGVFLWRRRMLPIATVGAVVPKYGAVVLNVDRRTLNGAVQRRPRRRRRRTLSYSASPSR
jgi:hypothetical protein